MLPPAAHPLPQPSAPAVGSAPQPLHIHGTQHGASWPREVTELHVHLGGSVPLYRLWEISINRGIRGVGDGYEDFVNMLKLQNGTVADLDSYLQVYEHVELIQSGPNAVRESVIIAIHRAFCTGGLIHVGSGAENITHESLFSIGRFELRWNPLKRTGAVFLRGSHAGLYDLDRVIKSAINAAEEVQLGFRGRIEVGQIFCFGRELTFEANMALAKKTRLWREKSNAIVGIDLAGNESVNPLSDRRKLEQMRIVFDEAGPGLGRTIHLGETRHVDIDTFVATIETLKPSRVAHPFTALRALREKRDDRGIKILKERRIVCELCVKSNLLTGAVRDLHEYGRIINTLDEYGVEYTFSTDAPSLQGSSLAEELVLLIESKAATPEQVTRALRVAEKASFLPHRAPHIHAH